MVLIIGIVGAFLYSNYNEKQFDKYSQKGLEFYNITKYDSAKISFEKALEYKSRDSIQAKVEMLNVLIPAMKLFYDAKYKDAFEAFKKASALGSGDADYYLGELSYNGLGTIKDYKKGSEYTNKAVNRGFKMGCWRIAYAYQTGKGVEKNEDKADRLYLEAIEAMKKIAEANDPEALGNLGSMYYSGKGVSKNEKVAFEYYLKSANLGYSFVQSELAQVYKHGIGTEKNMNEAVRWLKKSADKGNPNSLLGLGNMYLTGDGVEKNV